MKLVEGTPLDSIMKELGKLPIPMIEAILAQVGGAFGYAATRGQRDFSSVQKVVATKYEVLVEHKFLSQGQELLAKMPGRKVDL